MDSKRNSSSSAQDLRCTYGRTRGSFWLRDPGLPRSSRYPALPAAARMIPPTAAPWLVLFRGYYRFIFVLFIAGFERYPPKWYLKSRIG